MLQYLAYTCGLVRGALANLGLNCIVTAEVSTMPACEFSIIIIFYYLFSIYQKEQYKIQQEQNNTKWTINQWHMPGIKSKQITAT